uniref:Uncharacterized protein n=1 Tax=viral metagenome TaxID=1070528 RepID=A0A6C0ARF0_9ZZZZ
MENLDANVVLPPFPPQNEVKLVNVPIKDENTALNVMVSFLSLAQKRGAFGIDESAKIWECIQLFQKPQQV